MPIQEQSITVNGKSYSVCGSGQRSLLSVLRDELGLTGAKYGCGEAQCGACVVHVGGVPAPSCVTPIEDVANREVLTIEGLECSEDLHPVQQAFIDAEALQCGYCTPGMIMGVVALLTRNPDPTEEQIKAILQKHVCRCGAYRRIIKAVHLAAGKLGGT